MNGLTRGMQFPPRISALRHTAQQRWFDWDPRVTKKDGKPAITGTKYAFVAAKIPVVLLQDVAGLGQKGAIIEVKRGFARNNLVPNGKAVYGTTWENIDAYADPELLNKEKVMQAGGSLKRVIPFEWINHIRLEFLRSVVAPGKSILADPVTVADILMAISTQESIDLLPSQVKILNNALNDVGRHTVDVTLSLTVGTFHYQFTVDIKDKAEVAAAERREAELKEAMKMKRPEFVLGASRSTSGAVSHDDNEEFVDGEEGADSDSD